MIPISDDTPRSRTPVVTWGLIAVNVWVFLRETRIPPGQVESFFHAFGIVPARIAAGGLDLQTTLPFLTSMFVHGGWLHLAGNMWTLWIFGDNVEDRMGRLPYLLFYLLSGIAAGVIHAASEPGSAVPTVGASGAIAGVLGAYFVLFPRARVLTVIPIFFWPFFFVVPAFVYLGLWFALQFLSGTASLAAGPAVSGGVAWWAHVGGFAFGAGVLLSLFDVGKMRRAQEHQRHKVAWDLARSRRRGGIL